MWKSFGFSSDLCKVKLVNLIQISKNNNNLSVKRFGTKHIQTGDTNNVFLLKCGIFTLGVSDILFNKFLLLFF
jgi:hypothetical protein